MSRSKRFTSYEERKLRAIKYAAMKRAAMLAPEQQFKTYDGQTFTVFAVCASLVWVTEQSHPVSAISIDFTATEALHNER